MKSRTASRSSTRSRASLGRPAWIRYTVYMLAAIVVIAFVSGVVFLR